MKEAFSIGLWLVLTGAAITTVIFFAQTMRSKEPVSIGLYENRVHTLGSLIYLTLVVIGGMAIVGVGVYGLLTWLPRSLDEFRAGLAGWAAILSSVGLTHLEKASFDRQQLAVERGAQLWIANHMGNFDARSDRVIEQLEEESRVQNKTDTEYLIARQTLILAKEIKERDERKEAQRIEREQDKCERQVRQVTEDAAQKAAKAAEAAQKAAKEARAMEVRAALSQLVRTSPTVQDVNALHEDEEAVLDGDLIAVSWHRFKDFAARALQPQAEGQLALLLQELSGVTLIHGVETQIQEGLKYGDRYCDAYAIFDGEQLPLREGVRFTETAEGLLNAFFLSACLPGQWSWGHGFYDRDHELIARGVSGLDCLLTDTPFATTRQEGTFVEKWPPAGVRIVRRRDTFEVACLAFRAGRGISDLSINVTGGKASALREREVYIWGGGVYY